MSGILHLCRADHNCTAHSCRADHNGGDSVVSQLVAFDSVHGAGDNHFGTAIDGFPVARIPDVFFALSGTDISALVRKARSLQQR